MSDSELGYVLTAEEILAAEDIEEKWIDVPEWRKADGTPGRVKIRALSLRQIANVAQRSVRRNPQTGQDETNREMSVIMTLQEGMVDPKLTPDQARKMPLKSAAAVTRIVQAINALGPTPEAVDEADKSLWEESDAPVPIRVGAGVGHDPQASDNGNVN
jgi:hypothetical protein